LNYKVTGSGFLRVTPPPRKEEAMPNLTGQSIGRYHILEQLGEGGMATVYKAYDTRLERNVALKVLRTEQFSLVLLEQVLQRFEREAKSLAKLSHSNIVNILDYGEFEGSPYLVMEYLPGGTLKQKLGQAIPWQEAIQTLFLVARGLAYAHQHGVIHRDVKPANILLDENEEPVLTDFGIAKLLEGTGGHTLTGSGVGIGTPEYMAPEQGIGASTIDARADIYSLGIVLYEMVTGRKPYVADTPMAVVLKQMTDPLPRPTEFAPDLPDGVERILFKALAKQPADRYADMNALITAMEDVLSEKQKVEAPAPAKRLRKGAVQRTKLWPKLVMAIIGVLAIISVIVFGMPLIKQQFSGEPVAISTVEHFAPITPTFTLFPPTSTLVLSPSPTLTRTPRLTSTNTPIPAWVTDFAEPILAAIKDRKPDFQDDFSSDEPKGWWAPLQAGADTSISIEEGVMRLIGGGTASNIYLQRQSNFVYQVDISRPNSSRTNIRINNRNSIYLVRNGWGTCRDWSDCGSNYSFSFNSKILVTIIVKDTQAGYYLMGVPVFHYTDSDLGGDIWATPMIDCDTSCEIDNVKFWNLDKIPNLP
jgi:serine/threonine protein kinase